MNVKKADLLLAHGLITLLAWPCANADTHGEHTNTHERTHQTVHDNGTEVIPVTGQRIVSRKPGNTPTPRLVYDTAFFQKFEPISVGDMLRRVPGITFQSDIGEYAGPRMRGIDAQYTQVLVNGKRLPTFGNNHALAVDRIPAELVKRIEIARSPSAHMDGQGVAGSLNIILKQGAKIDGTMWRLGSINTKDTRGSAYASYGSSSNAISWGASVNIQDRYNPKTTIKDTRSFEQGAALGDVENEVQSDRRDSRDIAITSDIVWHLDESRRLSMNAIVIDTQRDELEKKRQSGFTLDDDNQLIKFDTANNEFNTIEHRTLGWSGTYDIQLESDTSMVLTMHFDRMNANENTLDKSGDTGSLLYFDSQELIDINDDNLTIKIQRFQSYETRYGVHGFEFRQKERDFLKTELEEDGAIVSDNTEFANFSVKEQRLDGFFSLTWPTTNSAWVMEAGLRLEYTHLRIQGRDFFASDMAANSDQLQMLPSLHVQWNMDKYQKLRFSLARTVRRPGFEQLNPVALRLDEDEEIFSGNPNLEQETSSGLDVEYEIHPTENNDLAAFSANVFYRQIDGLIQSTVQNTDLDGAIYALHTLENNINTGDIWGIEFASSIPVKASSSLTVNYSWLDSRIEDSFFTGFEHRFNDQSRYVYNIGFDHRFETWELMGGINYQKQGDAQAFEGNEVIDTSVGGNLELFLEWPLLFGQELLLRLSAQNLLDAKRIEYTRVYEHLESFKLDYFSEQEVDTEETSPSVMLTLRGSF